MVFENGVTNIQAAAYNGARTVSDILTMILIVFKSGKTSWCRISILSNMYLK